MKQSEHVTLRQEGAGSDVLYVVTETRNTIRWKIGDVLTAYDVRNINVAYTVKGGGDTPNWIEGAIEVARAYNKAQERNRIGDRVRLGAKPDNFS